MTDLSNVKALQSNTKCTIRFKQFLMPFGLLSKDTILRVRPLPPAPTGPSSYPDLQARDVLVNIGSFIKDLNKSLVSQEVATSHDATLRLRSSYTSHSLAFTSA